MTSIVLPLILLLGKKSFSVASEQTGNDGFRLTATVTRFEIGR